MEIGFSIFCLSMSFFFSLYTTYRWKLGYDNYKYGRIISGEIIKIWPGGDDSLPAITTEIYVKGSRREVGLNGIAGIYRQFHIGQVVDMIYTKDHYNSYTYASDPNFKKIALKQVKSYRLLSVVAVSSFLGSVLFFISFFE